MSALSSPPLSPRVAIEFASHVENPLVALGPGRHSMGTDPASDIVIRGVGARRHHADLSVGLNGAMVLTCRPGATVYVGARAVRCQAIEPGAVLCFGEEYLVVHLLEPGESLEYAAVPGLRGRSALLRALARTVSLFAPMQVPVLIHGPSGTGKDAVAAALHGGSEAAKSTRPFVVANVASLPRELCESELFGHAKGSFTGADRDHPGLLMQAHGGTLFLDEIGELPLDVQPKLLRALDGYGFRAVGGRAALQPNVRIITASHVDLRVAVRAKQFRNDLLHRLEVLVVSTPPLAARPTDIVAISLAIVAQDASKLRRVALAPSAMARLMGMPWEGNVRELRNVLLRAVALGTSYEISSDDIRAAEARLGGVPHRHTFVSGARAVEILVEAGGNATRAAEVAGMARTTFRRRVASVRPAADRRRRACAPQEEKSRTFAHAADSCEIPSYIGQFLAAE